MAMLLALALLQPSENPSGWLTAALSAHVIAQTADASTTAFAVGTGRFVEANPLMRWATDDPLVLGLVKGGFAVVSTLALLKIAKRHPRAALVTAWVITAMTSAAAVHNARQLRKVR